MPPLGCEDNSSDGEVVRKHRRPIERGQLENQAAEFCELLCRSHQFGRVLSSLCIPRALAPTKGMHRAMRSCQTCHDQQYSAKVR